MHPSRLQPIIGMIHLSSPYYWTSNPLDLEAVVRRVKGGWACGRYLVLGATFERCETTHRLDSLEP